jgi:hypothetical protein
MKPSLVRLAWFAGGAVAALVLVGVLPGCRYSFQTVGSNSGPMIYRIDHLTGEVAVSLGAAGWVSIP